MYCNECKAAVNLLCKRGLVTRKRHKGTIVRPIENSAILRQIMPAEDKLIYLLYSDNSTKIHWDETSIRSFCETAKKHKYHTILQKIPEERKSLETFQHDCCSEEKTGELMVFLACKKLFPANLNTFFSIRLTGEFIRRKTF